MRTVRTVRQVLGELVRAVFRLGVDGVGGGGELVVVHGGEARAAGDLDLRSACAVAAVGGARGLCVAVGSITRLLPWASLGSGGEAGPTP